jgi:hypothetical protein
LGYLISSFARLALIYIAQDNIYSYAHREYAYRLYIDRYLHYNVSANSEDAIQDILIARDAAQQNTSTTDKSDKFKKRIDSWSNVAVKELRRRFGGATEIQPRVFEKFLDPSELAFGLQDLRSPFDLNSYRDTSGFGEVPTVLRDGGVFLEGAEGLGRISILSVAQAEFVLSELLNPNSSLAQQLGDKVIIDRNAAAETSEHPPFRMWVMEELLMKLLHPDLADLTWMVVDHWIQSGSYSLQEILANVETIGAMKTSEALYEYNFNHFPDLDLIIDRANMVERLLRDIFDESNAKYGKKGRAVATPREAQGQYKSYVTMEMVAELEARPDSLFYRWRLLRSPVVWREPKLFGIFGNHKIRSNADVTWYRVVRDDFELLNSAVEINPNGVEALRKADPLPDSFDVKYREFNRSGLFFDSGDGKGYRLSALRAVLKLRAIVETSSVGSKAVK